MYQQTKKNTKKIWPLKKTEKKTEKETMMGFCEKDK